jgi:RNA polymerase-binding transcription factor DksA
VEDVVKKDKHVLEAELESLRTQIAKLEDALEDKPDYGLGEGDPAITQWEMNYALLERLRGRRERVKQALSRAEGGTYGVCVQCGREIHPDRLAVLPDAQLCIECAREQ